MLEGVFIDQAIEVFFQRNWLQVLAITLTP